MRMKTIHWIGILILVFLLAGCTVSQRLDFSPVPPKADFTFNVEEFFVDVLEDSRLLQPEIKKALVTPLGSIFF